MLRSLSLRSAAALLLMCGADIALAQTATTTFNVNATVQATCLVQAEDLAFPDYVPGTGAQDATTTIDVRCTNGTAYTVALNGGSTAGGTVAQRLMANGANTLEYNLYTDAARTTLWGDGTTGTAVTGTGAGIGNVQQHTVYGRLPDSAANQNAVPGGYSDVVTVTVTF